jgi:hypothetical protein
VVYYIQVESLPTDKERIKMSDFLSRLNSKVAAKRTSTQALAKTLGQSPTKTESSWVHGVNITRAAELYIHEPKEYTRFLRTRKAVSNATPQEWARIVRAIKLECGIVELMDAGLLEIEGS